MPEHEEKETQPVVATLTYDEVRMLIEEDRQRTIQAALEALHLTDITPEQMAEIRSIADFVSTTKKGIAKTLSRAIVWGIMALLAAGAYSTGLKFFGK